MSYTPEDLHTGIVELFDDAASLSLRPWGTLPLVVSFRDFRSLDTTRLRMRVTRVARTIITLTPVRQSGPHSKLVCNFCGARSSQHRCPVTGGLVSE